MLAQRCHSIFAQARYDGAEFLSQGNVQPGGLWPPAGSATPHFDCDRVIRDGYVILSIQIQRLPDCVRKNLLMHRISTHLGIDDSNGCPSHLTDGNQG